jgi:glycosyltransferase involved in cell wall biosynthesis
MMPLATDSELLAAPVTVRQPLRICLYYPWLYLTSGGERTIVETVRRSRHHFVIYTNEFQPDSTFPELRDLDVRVLNRVPVQRSIVAVARAAARILFQRVDLSGFDAILVVCEGLGDLFVLRHYHVPALCLCLTPLRIAFDEHYRATYMSGRGIPQRLAVGIGTRLFRFVDRIAWSRYCKVFAISAEVHRRILGGRLAPPERIEILHPGIDVSAYRSGPSGSRTFFVPGRIMWTKNLHLAIRAFREFRRRHGGEGWRLCIAGIVDEKSRPYFAELQREAAGEPVDFIERPDDAEMRRRYAECFATLFTAFNEDWGLVMIESLASGKPVVAVNRGGPLEIVEHGRTGLLVEPTPRAFAEAMLELVQNQGLYAAMGRNGASASKKYDWAAFVDRLDEALVAATAAHSRSRDLARSS